MLAEVVGEDDEEVPLAVDELGHDAEHVDVSVVAVGLEAVAAEHLQPVALFLKVEVGVLGVDCDVVHPLVHNLRHLSDDALLYEPGLVTVVVMLV